MNAKKGFTLVELLVVIGILGILMGALFPAISSAMIRANMSAFGMRGRNLFVAITSANTEREAAGLPSVWPRDSDLSDDTDDIAGQQMSQAEKYFTKLFDLENMANAQKWSPYVTGVDISALSGSGVTPITGGAKEFKGQNVGWAVACNVADEMEDIIPVLVSRNMSIDKLAKGGDNFTGTEKEDIGLGLEGGAQYDTPFANKAFVMIRKGGGVLNMTGKYSTQRVVYNKQTFTISDTNFKYIQPSK